MKFTYKQTAIGTMFEFENGTRLETDAKSGSGYVVHPARDGVGEFSFPVRHTGDVFHAFRIGEALACNVPASCRAW